MTITEREELLEALAELSNFYPSMRFGQLFEFACLLSSEDGGFEVAKVEDQEVLHKVQEHVRKRGSNLGLQGNDNVAALPSIRLELIRALRELGKSFPDWRFGQLLGWIAASSHANLYDFEDQDFLERAEEAIKNGAVLWRCPLCGRSEKESAYPGLEAGRRSLGGH